MELYLVSTALVLLVVWFAIQYARAIPGLWKTSDRFNSTADWAPVPDHGQKPPPPFSEPPEETCLRIITPHLEAGEGLEGFARGYFSPPRPQDWFPGIRRVSKCPLAIAVTSRRLLMLELTYPGIVFQRCCIAYEDIQYLNPPKPEPLGTIGCLSFGLASGREYQLRFLGPIIFPEFMRQERRLAAYLREIAPRFQPAETRLGAAA